MLYSVWDYYAWDCVGGWSPHPWGIPFDPPSWAATSTPSVRRRCLDRYLGHEYSGHIRCARGRGHEGPHASYTGTAVNVVAHIWE